MKCAGMLSAQGGEIFEANRFDEGSKRIL